MIARPYNGHPVKGNISASAQQYPPLQGEELRHVQAGTWITTAVPLALTISIEPLLPSTS